MAPKNSQKNFTNDKSRGTTRKYRNKKSNSNSKATFKGKDDDVMDKRPNGNDPRWWGPKPYVDAVGHFNFANPLGKAVPWSFNNDPLSEAHISMSNDNYATTTIPGVMALDFLPTFGVGEYVSDPVNTYFRTFFTKLRSTNNQNAPYQPPDLAMYVMAVDSIHICLQYLIRLYGIARTYSVMNRYLPQALIEAMGVDPNHASFKLYGNLADFRAEILNLMVKIQTLAIPKDISLCNRHRSMVEAVYLDGNTSKSQVYFFKPSYLYKFNETYSQSGGGLEAVAVPPAGSSAYAWISFAHTLIDPLMQSSVYANASGDIVKSFGYDNLYVMPFFDETYSIVPVYNPEILLEIHNAKVCGDRFDSTAFDIVQDVNTASLICHPYFGTSGPTAGPVDCLIDVPVDNPDADTVMVATRLTCTGPYTYDATASKYKFVPSAVGTEVVTGLSMYYYNKSGILVKSSLETNVVSGTTHGVIAQIEKECFFDWHPHMYHISGNATGSMTMYGVVSELSNYTVMSAGDIQKMHYIALNGALTLIGVENAGLK